jgi:hypothetical protein
MQPKNSPLMEDQMVEHVRYLPTDKIDIWMKEMYHVMQELQILQAMSAEMCVGPRNANDAYAIQALEVRMRVIRRERNALHKLIHQEPMIGTKEENWQQGLHLPDSQ